MNSNIVKIGKALKWRGVYDNSKKYYAENVITCYGGVFRCNVSVAQGIPPYEMNEDGLPTIQNSETWTCLVDTTWIIEWVLAFNKFKDDVLARFVDNERHIQEHCNQLETHQENLKSLENSVLELQRVDESHEETLYNHEQWIRGIDNQVLKNTENIDKLNEKANEQNLSLEALALKIQETNGRIDTEVRGLNKTIASQAETIRQNTEKIESLELQIKELQESIELMSKYNCCFSSGVWDNELYWNNESVWNNGNGSDDGNGGIQSELSMIDYDEGTGELEISGSVISYDEKTGTLSIIDETNFYDAATGTLYIDKFDEGIQTEMSMEEYEEKTGELGVNGSVINYDEETGTLSIIDETNTYDEETGTLFIDRVLGQ